MATTTEYLTQLQADKQNLVNKLSEKGVETTGNETFTELVPKLDEIQGEGAKAKLSYVSFRDYKGININEDIKKIDTSETISMYMMFLGCITAQVLDLSLFDTSEVKDLTSMFNGCSNLETLNMENSNLGKVEKCGFMFLGASALTNLKFGYNLGKGYVTKKSNDYDCRMFISNSNALTHASLMSVINGLYDLNLTYNVANGGTLYTQTLFLGETNKAKLIVEEIAIATDKGWSVS